VIDKDARSDVPKRASGDDNDGHQSHYSSFVCSACSACFPSEKALMQHSRVKHDARNQVHDYLDGGTCPACKVNFVTHARCSAHIGDRRRPMCRMRILSGEFPKVPPEMVSKLDESDRALRKAARKLGRTHVIACVAATDKNGRTVGRITSAPPRSSLRLYS